MHAIAVTNPQGRTRYVGQVLPWVDDAELALPFDTAEEAREYIDNAWTDANARKRAGWIVSVEKY